MWQNIFINLSILKSFHKYASCRKHIKDGVINKECCFRYSFPKKKNQMKISTVIFSFAIAEDVRLEYSTQLLKDCCAGTLEGTLVDSH